MTELRLSVDERVALGGRSWCLPPRYVESKVGDSLATRSVELNSAELVAIEQALARVSPHEVSAWLGSPPEAAGTLLSTLLGKVTLAASSRPCPAIEALPAGRERPALAPVPPVVSIDEPSLTINIASERLVCRPTSFRLLSYLIVRQGCWVRSDELGREVLQASFQPGSPNVRWHVFQARRALKSFRHALHGDNSLGFMFALMRCDRRHCQG